MRIAALLLSSLVACSRSTPPQSAPIAATGVDLAPLSTWLKELGVHDRWQGSVAVVDPSGPVFLQAEGLLEPGGSPVNTETRFRIGSVTKTYTAVVVMQLVEEGALTLDSRLSTWFPQVPNADRITVEQLLDHHSGVYSFTDAEDYSTWMTQPSTPQELLARIVDAEPVFEPGAEGRYSNSGYVLLGMVIEAIEGKPFAEVLQERIFDRLGTVRSGHGGPIDPQRNEARSVVWNGRSWILAPETDMSIPGGAGALVSTPNEMCTFIRAVFDGTLVSPDSSTVMMTLDGKYGHGLFPFPYGDRTAWGHTGAIDGFASMLGYFPDDKRCVAMTTHAESTDTNGILLAVLDTVYGVPWTAPTVTSPLVLDPEALQAFVGVYTSEELPLELTLTVVDGVLHGQGTGQPAFPLTAEGPRTFVFEAAGLKLVFGDDGAMTMHQRDTYAYQRKP